MDLTRFKAKGFRTFRIQQDGFGGWDLIGMGEYPDGVLEGQWRRGVLKSYDTLEEAVTDNPDVEVDKEYSSKIPSSWLPVSNVAPSWFDPADAGERWDEDY
jgi:hypothetical protein